MHFVFSPPPSPGQNNPIEQGKPTYSYGSPGLRLCHAVKAAYRLIVSRRLMSLESSNSLQVVFRTLTICFRSYSWRQSTSWALLSRDEWPDWARPPFVLSRLGFAAYLRLEDGTEGRSLHVSASGSGFWVAGPRGPFNPCCLAHPHAPGKHLPMNVARADQP